MTAASLLEDIVAVMSRFSAGARTERVGLPWKPAPDDVATRLGSALNVLLDDIAARMTAAEAATRRLEVLTTAAHEFSEATQDAERLLGAVARQLASVLKDQCVVRLVSDDGRALVPVAVHGVDDDAQRLAQEAYAEPMLLERFPIVRHVHETGEPFVVAKLDVASIRTSVTAALYEWGRRVGIHSLMMLPLRTRGVSFGQILLLRYRPESGPYTTEDKSLATALADHAAIAIANSRAYASERAARDQADHAADALRAAQARFARLDESGLLGVVVHDLAEDPVVIEINDALLRMVDYKREELVGQPAVWERLTPGEWRESDAPMVGRLKTSRFLDLREKEYFHKSGRRVPVMIGAAMLGTARPQSISFVLDLTQLKAAQAAVEKLREERASDARFRALLEAAPDAMIISDSADNIVLVNTRAEDLFLYGRDELIGKPIVTLMRNPLRGPYAAGDAARADGPDAFTGFGLEVRAQRKGGDEFPAEVNVSPLETQQGLLVSRSIRDLSERKRAELQRARLAAIVDSSDDAIIGKTLEGTITSWNQGAARLFGYDASEAIGKSVMMLIPRDHEQEERAIVDTVSNGRVLRLDTERLRKDGSRIAVSLTSSPVRDGLGTVVGISKVARDITERKQAELALAQARDAAEAASRELEAFSYSVAHDLRAPLRGMSGFAQLLIDTYLDKLDADGQDWLHEIIGNARRMGELIDGLLSLARTSRSELKRENVDLSVLARQVAGRLAESDPQRAVNVVVDEDLGAYVDSRLASALLSNLIGNAWKFTSKVSAPRIEFASTHRDGCPVFFVRDNGAGFDMAFAAKLFAPFQRLHAAREFPGTGIGLATVQRIVHRHGGRAWAEGSVGRGATFFFTLPARTSGDWHEQGDSSR